MDRWSAYEKKICLWKVDNIFDLKYYNLNFKLDLLDLWKTGAGL